MDKQGERYTTAGGDDKAGRQEDVMNQPYMALESLVCADCTQAGRPGVAMRVVMYDHQWMNVSTAEPDPLYPSIVSIRTRRKKVRYALWRCPHGHRHQTVLA